MNIIQTVRFKDTKATIYTFGPHTYIHVGAWPPYFQPGVYSVPILHAKTEDGRDITHILRQFAGPRHVINEEVISCTLGKWKLELDWSFTWTGFRISTIWRLVPFEKNTLIHVTNILGQSFTFGAR
jgi:hypothetical protein